MKDFPLLEYVMTGREVFVSACHFCINITCMDGFFLFWFQLIKIFFDDKYSDSANTDKVPNCLSHTLLGKCNNNRRKHLTRGESSNEIYVHQV